MRAWEGAGPLLAAAAVAATAAIAAATLGAGAPSGKSLDPGAPASDPAPAAQEEAPYDGRFTFVRIRFESGGRGMRGWGRGGREPLWAHDNPRAERNFAKILDATTFVGPHLEGQAGRILSLDDPELFRYPVAYIVEVGYWQPGEAERTGLREFLLKGGFLIVDDFRGGDIYNFQSQMAQVLPGAELMEVTPDHEIFDSFFHIEDPSALAPPTYAQYPPMYLGIFEGNDPAKRLMVMVNYNNDIAEYWEYSDYGMLPIDLTNEAYKFGVNYVIYAMTH